jgi:hypothetical protein
MGATLEPEHPYRRFIKHGPILTVDTGAGKVPMDAFDVSVMRENHLDEKSHEL